MIMSIVIWNFKNKGYISNGISHTIEFQILACFCWCISTEAWKVWLRGRKAFGNIVCLSSAATPFAQSSWSQCFLNSRFKSQFKIATKWTFYVMFSFTLDIMSQLYLMFENILFQTFESFQNILILFYTAVWEVRKILGWSFFKLLPP